MLKKTHGAVLALTLLALVPQIGHAHCQVPCGIYDDAARIVAMFEDAATIEKAMVQMKELAGKNDPQSANQLTRWIMTKETHADNIITTVSEYFLTQKVKPIAEGADGHDQYLHKLANHHLVLVAAMKTKQNCDLEYVAVLRSALDALGNHYEMGHLREH